MFPALDEVVNVDWELRYNEDEDICGYLLLNDKLVQVVNYTNLYGAAFTFTDVEAVGFDIYVPVKYDIVISNVTVENIAEGEAIPTKPVYYGGWENYKNGATEFAKADDGKVTLTLGGTSFGSSFVLNEDILQGITGEFAVEFDLTMTLTNQKEHWVSLVTYVNDKNVMRYGLHFFNNTWNNVAFYGSVQKGDPEAEVIETGFFAVIWPEGTPEAPETFVAPALTETFKVKMTYTYDADENVISTLYLNGNAVGSVNLNEYFGVDYDINDLASVGFDQFINEEGCAVVTNYIVTAIQ